MNRYKYNRIMDMLFIVGIIVLFIVGVGEWL